MTNYLTDADGIEWMTAYEVRQRLDIGPQRLSQLARRLERDDNRGATFYSRRSVEFYRVNRGRQDKPQPPWTHRELLPRRLEAALDELSTAAAQAIPRTGILQGDLHLMVWCDKCGVAPSLPCRRLHKTDHAVHPVRITAAERLGQALVVVALAE